jgi:bacterial/archaeal transporter family-2 protein
MNNSVISLVITLLTGALIALQSSWSGLAGKQLGALNATLLGLVAGGFTAAVILVFRRGVATEALTASTWYVVGTGVSGIVIGSSISFVVQRVGVTATLTGIMLGQLLVAFVIDLLGWSGTTIPLETKRVIGLLLLIVAVYFIVPRS